MRVVSALNALILRLECSGAPPHPRPRRSALP
nr:MAG TPA: hypothetical protein [Caudoviricetes sp.]